MASDVCGGVMIPSGLIPVSSSIQAVLFVCTRFDIFPFVLIQLNNKKSIAEILYMLGVHFAYFHGPIGYFQSWTIVSVHCFLQGNAHHKIQHGYDHWQRFQWYFIIFKTQCKTYDQRVTHFTSVDWNQSIHCSYSYKEYS